jgi:ligand-binding sensor domain-containing protein/signal transduction histidine kinase
MSVFAIALLSSCNFYEFHSTDGAVFKPLPTAEIQKPEIRYINQKEVPFFAPGHNGIPLPQRIIAGKPKVKEISGSVQVKPGVSFLPLSTEAERDGMHKVLSERPKKVRLSPEDLKACLTDRDSFKQPNVYKIKDPALFGSQSRNFTIQNGDTIFQAISKIFPQPLQQEAMLPRYKNDAIFNIQYLDVEQGLAFSNVWTIIEDKHANLWFGTDGAGVSKYDGKFFTNYAKNEGLSDDIIRSMIEDKNGNIWFGVWSGGVDKFDGETFTHYGLKEGLTNKVVRSIIEDKQGNLWFATLGSGVYKFDGTALTHFTKEQGLCSDSIYSVFQDRTENIWFGTSNNYLCRFNGHSFSHVSAYSQFGNVTVRAIVEDKLGNLWFGTEGKGVFKFDGNRIDALNQASGKPVTNPDLTVANGKYIKTLTQFTVKHGLPERNVYALIVDKWDNIWLGTNGGVCKFDGSSFSHYTEKEGLNSNYVRSMFGDRVGNIWIGTHGGGVSRFVSGSFKYYTEYEGLSNRRVLSMIEDKNHHLWFGTWDGGVCEFDGNFFSCYTDAQGLVNNNVRSILQDSYGNFWFATENGGVSKFDGKYFTNYTEKQGLGKNRVRKIIEDRLGNIWFGTFDGGITKYDGNRVKAIENGSTNQLNNGNDLHKINGKYVETLSQYTVKHGLSNNNIWDLFEDKSGSIWIATFGGGLSKFDGISFTNYSEKQGLKSKEVRSIIPDDLGNIWIATNGGGVSKFDGHTFITYTEKEGISNNYVRSLLKDPRGGIWIGTINGITYLKKTSKKENRNDQMQIFNFGQQDGLNGSEFYPNSVLLDSKNRLWFGSGKALNTIDLNNFELPDTKPRVQLNNIKISDEFIDFRLYKQNFKNNDIQFTSVANFYNYPLNLVLPYNLNHLTFQFSATDWSAPDKIKYQYKLKGLDLDWSKINVRSFADYRNIPYGKYTFQIKALSLSGIWSNTFEYKFEILPPWWQTLWFRVVFAVCFLGSGIGFYFYRINSLLHQREQLEKKVAKRTIELKQANDNLAERQNEILLQNKEISKQAYDLKLSRDQLLVVNKHLIIQKEEVNQALTRLKKAQSQLVKSEKLASIGILTSGIAHEINNPLNFIMSGNAAIENYINENLVEHEKNLSPLLKIVNTGIQRATEIITSLENFNRKSDTSSENCDIHKIINNCLVMLQNKFKNKVEVEKFYSSQPYLLIGDEGDLHQAILNILVNAEESIQQTGAIYISTFFDKNKLEIQICDTGIGIKNENMNKIFDPFFTTKDPGKGIGLGLSIALNIINEHKGTIEFQSEPGNGTKVIIILPNKLGHER